jgi:hypothetical protein
LPEVDRSEFADRQAYETKELEMTLRLLTAVENFLKGLEHHKPRPTDDLVAHVPVPALIELREAHAEAASAPPAAPPAEEPPPESIA